jgi:hypothetical protein
LRVFYADDDPGKMIGEEQFPPGTAKQGPEDGIMGHGHAEKG